MIFQCTIFSWDNSSLRHSFIIIMFISLAQFRLTLILKIVLVPFLFWYIYSNHSVWGLLPLEVKEEFSSHTVSQSGQLGQQYPSSGSDSPLFPPKVLPGKEFSICPALDPLPPCSWEPSWPGRMCSTKGQGQLVCWSASSFHQWWFWCPWPLCSQALTPPWRDSPWETSKSWHTWPVCQS